MTLEEIIATLKHIGWTNAMIRQEVNRILREHRKA